MPRYEYRHTLGEIKTVLSTNKIFPSDGINNYMVVHVEKGGGLYSGFLHVL